jgi:hypothetical protein
MNETSQTAEKHCPQCGGAVTEDSKFCRHCAFNLTAPAPTELSLSRSERVALFNKRTAVLIAAATTAVLLVALLALMIYRNRQQPAPSAAASDQIMSQRALQVEVQILNGASLTNADLAGLSAYELRVLRNVHFARYGRSYERPGLGDYFFTRAWYQPDASYHDKLLTVTDKANIKLILAQENQAKAAEAAAALASVTTAPVSESTSNSFGSLFNAGLTTEKVQRAVDAMADWTRKGGAIQVLGIQELPQQNQAKADLQFDDFLYNATELGIPVAKDKAPPPPPDRNSPNFWADLARATTQQVRVTRYAGSGVAMLKHYNDGRWVLTSVQFGMHSLTGNIEIR